MKEVTNYEEYNSSLGNVAVAKDHVERAERDSDVWKSLEENFGASEIADSIHFSQVEAVKFQPESAYPQIKLHTKDGWKRLFFAEEEVAEKCFKKVRYNWSAFQQNFG